MRLFLAGVVVLGVALSACAAPQPGGRSLPTFAITTTKPADRVTPVVAANSVRFDVASETGIGGARVALRTGSWPATVKLRFALRGLEELRFQYGETTIVVNVPNTAGAPPRESLAAADGEQPLSPGSPYWLDVAVERAQDGSVTAIEVTAPADFHKASPQAFDVQWIDFYR